MTINATSEHAGSWGKRQDVRGLSQLSRGVARLRGREGDGKSALLLLPEQWRLQRGAQVPARRSL